MDCKELQKTATQIRMTIIKAVSAAGSGHPGGSLSAADILTTLFFKVMDVDPKNPQKPDRDKFILSKGHAAPVLYATLAEKGFFPKEDVLTLRKINGKFQGHPDMNKVIGVEMSTGSLGQGLSAAVGMAMANKIDRNPGRIYALMGDGEIQEGMIWEAAMSASHYKLDNLTGIVDWNGIQIDGRNDEIMTVTPVADKFKAFGWNVINADGHDINELIDAFEKAKRFKGKPSVIVAKTVKGKGVSFMENTNAWHGKAPDEDQTKKALEELGGAL